MMKAGVWVRCLAVCACLCAVSCYSVSDSGGAPQDTGTGDGSVDVGRRTQDGGRDASGLADTGEESDAGAVDTGTNDAGHADAAAPDAAGLDAGAGDGSTADAGGDAGVTDTGVDPCLNHCTNGKQDCGETGQDCGGECDPCPGACDGHCYNGKADCGETGKDCGGECSACGSGGCSFPQGVPESDFVPGTGSDDAIGQAVNQVMTALTGCNPMSDCYIGDKYPDGQPWFVDVAQALRDQGFCAGQHEIGYTDEIAVNDTGCTGRWYGYHIYNYGGLKVVWHPGADRGWWAIDPKWCP